MDLGKLTFPTRWWLIDLADLVYLALANLQYSPAPAASKNNPWLKNGQN